MKKNLLGIAFTALVMSSSMTSFAEITGSGTEADPYLIQTKEDLCNAYTKVASGQLTYFKQTADIDMAGVEEYVAFSGHNADYTSSINYDGQNHLIKNFAPVDRVAGAGANAYYCTSIFGVFSGTLKNLGVVDALVDVDWFEAGIIGGFAGVTAATNSTEVVVENVFVTGKILSYKAGAVAGAMFGTSGLPVKFVNCYAQVEIDNEGGYAAGLIGKAATETTITNTYVSATLKGEPAALVAAADPGNAPAITFENVVAFGTGDACNVATTGTATVAPAGDAAAIATVQGWEAFNKGGLFNGLPALNWQNVGAGVNDVMTENAPVAYFNLCGNRVENPQSGIYIKKQGNKVAKVVIR